MQLYSVLLFTVLGLCARTGHTETTGAAEVAQRLGAGKPLLQDTLSLIYNRYEMFQEGNLGRTLMRAFSQLTTRTWDTLKFKYALKLLQGRPMVVLFTGSSVTAGHDVFYNESYPSVYARRLGPAMEALGAPLIVRNTAMGGSPCRPSNLCAEAQGGFDVDIYSWEQSYFCKRSSEQEVFARTVARSPNRALYIEQMSGTASTKQCPNITRRKADGPSYTSEHWRPDSVGLAPWSPGAAEVEEEKKYTSKHVSASNNWGSVYPSIGNAIFSSFLNIKGCSLQSPVPGARSGPCSVLEVLSKHCAALKFANAESATPWHNRLKGKILSWHPNPAMHMLRGEGLVWQHAMVLLDAIHMLEADLNGLGPDQLAKQYDAMLDKLHPATVGPPVLCNGLHCDREQQCFTDYTPHYNPARLLTSLVVSQGGWNRVVSDVKHSKAEYPDKFVRYVCEKGVDCGKLTVAVTVSSDAPFVLLYGHLNGVNVTVEVIRDGDHELNEDLSFWSHVTTTALAVTGAQMSLAELPPGRLALSLFPAPREFSSLSHVIMWT